MRELREDDMRWVSGGGGTYDSYNWGDFGLESENGNEWFTWDWNSSEDSLTLGWDFNDQYMFSYETSEFDFNIYFDDASNSWSGDWEYTPDPSWDFQLDWTEDSINVEIVYRF